MRLFSLVLAALAISVLPAKAEPRIHCPGQEENLATYLEIHKVLFMERDSSRINEFYAEQILSHNNDQGGGPGELRSSDYLAKMWERSREKEPNRVLEDELILCVDDFVVVRTTLKSNFNQPLMGFEPTGEPYAFTATDIYRFEDGRVVERWGNADFSFLMSQLGFRYTRD